jgi:phosphate starvation-inducible protein PhoH
MARKYKDSSKAPRQDTRQEQKEPVQSRSLKIRIDDLITLKPLTENQKKLFEAYDNDDDFIITHGYAGTGKTFLAIYKGLEEVLDPFNKMDKVIIVRSAVSGREIGHLPGDTDEKMDVYAAPYKNICAELFKRKDAWDRLVEQGKIVFESTSFLRGCTFDKSVIVVDELQNLSWQECSTICTRAGNDSRFIFCGDFRQTDLDKKKNDLSGIHKFLKVADKMKGCTKIEYAVEDIVRSQLVKDFIIATVRYEEAEK